MAQNDSAVAGLFSFISRRLWLKLSLGGVGALLGAGTGVLGLRGCASAVPDLRLLSDHGYRTFAAIARTHIPRGGPFELGADDFDIARLFDGFLADEPQQNIKDLQMALTLVELGPMIFEGRLATFSNLEPEEQLIHWKSWMTSDNATRRQVSLAFRKFISVVFFDQEEVWPHIGYPGPREI